MPPDRQRPPPSLAEFEALAEAAYARLPPEFRAMCEGLVIAIADFPTEAVLARMRCTTAFDLLGLFVGRGLAQGGGEVFTGQEPNRVWLYRRPILAYWAAHDDTLDALVAHVLVHEIGHHFGLSDADMAVIDGMD